MGPVMASSPRRPDGGPAPSVDFPTAGDEGPLVLRRVALEVRPRGRRIMARKFLNHAAGFVIGGEGVCIWEDEGGEQRGIIRPGMVFVRHRQCRAFGIEVASRADLQMIRVGFLGRRSRVLLQRLFPEPFSIISLRQPERVRELMLRVYEEAEDGGMYALEVCNGYLLALLHLIAEERTETPRTFDASQLAFLRSRSLLQREYREIRSVTDLAERTGFSPQYLCSLFRRHAGRTPYSYLTELRAREACHQLAHTDATVQEIAADLNFSDPYVFSKAFKRATGCSPTDYRQRAAAGEDL